MYRAWFFLLLLLFVPLHAITESEACGKEIEKIDAEVKKLNTQKQKYIDSANYYQQLGDNWQYSSGRIEDAHENWGKANDARQKAINLQMQIDLLLERKQRIFQFYPELWQP